MRRFALALLAACAIASPASPHALLAPDVGDPYFDLLRYAFAEANSGDAVLSATIMPNSGKEKAVALIRHRREGASILVLEPRVHLWRYQLVAMMENGEIRNLSEPSAEATRREIRELKKGLPKDPRDVRFNRCERRLPAQIATQIEGAWRVMLEQTGVDRDPDAPIYFHATTYAFAQRTPDGERRGWIYGGHNGRVRQLINLAHGMADFCERKASSDAVRDLAERLLPDEIVAPLPSGSN